MKFSLNWLCDFVDISVSADDLARRLSLAGHEVEEIIHVGQHLKDIRTGRIEDIQPHPDADRLVITRVFDGETTHQIVTGATNVFKGAIIPFAVPGSVMANGQMLKAAKLRGVESFGMLCSRSELGIERLPGEKDSEGIWILPEETPLGIDFIRHALLQDTLFDIGILPNRGDCQSIYGMAREVAVILDKPLKSPSVRLNEAPGSEEWQVSIAEPELCPYYSARLIKNVDNTRPTPLYIKRRLELSGIRPISLIVDITNYILLETGQPLHAFDYDKLNRESKNRTVPTLIVRLAGTNETLLTLDNEQRTLKPDNLLICREKEPVALAGVMGGASTEIDENSRNVLLEAAFFDPGAIRRSATSQGIRTESSVRFEKGVDIGQVALASDRAAQLMTELAGGTVVANLSVKKNPGYASFKQRIIDFSANGINALLGAGFRTADMILTLEKLGFVFSKDHSKVTVPSWRLQDVTELPCLAEETARILGYDHIPSVLPEKAVPVEKATRLETIAAKLETALIHSGFNQINTFTTISLDDYHRFSAVEPGESVILANPLNPDDAVLRPSLLPSFLSRAAHNYRHQNTRFSFFEIGKVFRQTASPFPAEETHVAMLSVGNRVSEAYTPELKKTGTPDMAALKGVAVNLLDELAVNAEFSKPQPTGADSSQDRTYAHFSPVACLDIIATDNREPSGNGTKTGIKIGIIGFLHPGTTAAYDIPENVAYILLNLSVLATIKPEVKTFNPIPKFPSTRRDIAMLVPKTTSYADVEAIIRKYKPKEVRDFFLFDHFESEKIGTDNTSLAFAFVYQDPAKTLEDERVNKIHESFCRILTQHLPVTIR